MLQSKREVFKSQVMEKKAVILVGPMAKSLPLGSAPRLGVDGGCLVSSIDAFALTVGDGDSSFFPSEQFDINLPSNKDLSDLACALTELPPHALTIHLHGFWGGRLDHQLLALGDVVQRVQDYHDIAIFYANEGHHLYVFPAGKHQLVIHGLFSVLSFSRASFTIQGACQFILSKTFLPPLNSRLLSNQGFGAVELSCDQTFCCYVESP